MYNLEDFKNSKGVALYNRAKTLIPGGTQLLSKRPEMFAPDVWLPCVPLYRKIRVFLLSKSSFASSVLSLGIIL